MATSHLYALSSGSTSWATNGVKAFNCWVWDGSVWQPVIKQWIWNGGAWVLGFDTTPGAIDHITVSPSSASVPAGTTRIFSVSAWDADGRFIDVSSGHSFAWTITNRADSISDNGNGTATFSGDPGSAGGEPYDDTISVTMDSTYSTTATATVT